MKLKKFPPTHTMSTHFHILLLYSFLLPVTTSDLPRFFSDIPGLPNVTLPTSWDAFANFSGCHHGESRDGLANIKHYFRQFGYLSHSHSNFTDEFDDSLAAALKTYQLNFNLNQTGFLDDSTLQQIVLPRCGVADIINGTSTMESRIRSGSMNSVVHYTFFRTHPRWPTRNLTYVFDSERMVHASVKEVFRRAFDKWAAVTPLTFTETVLFNGADIKIGFVYRDHGDGKTFDGKLGVLGHAFSPPDGRLHLDIEENWVIGNDISTSSLRGLIDLESVAMHEIGHVLGLRHSSIKKAIMFPTIPANTRKAELASDDIKGIQVLYGKNPYYNASSTQSASEMQSVVNFKWALVVIIGSMLLML